MAGESTFGLFETSFMNAPANPIWVFDRRFYARYIEAILDTSSLPLPDAAAEVDRIVERSSGALGRRIHPLSSIVMPALARSIDAFGRTAVYGDLVSLIVAIERYRLAHGAVPDELTQLVPEFLAELPPDPYADGPYLYLREDSGYAVYSVGPDRIDGKGEKMRGPRAGDICLRIMR
jgi:hypothetical protein